MKKTRSSLPLTWWALNPPLIEFLWHSAFLVFLGLLVFIFLMSFDRIEHTLLVVFFTKLSFVLFMVRCFFLIDSFLSSRRLWVAEKYRSCSRCTTDSEMRQNSILIHLFFLLLPDDVQCKIPIWPEDTALNLSCDKPSDLSQQVEIGYQSKFDLTNIKMQYQKY